MATTENIANSSGSPECGMYWQTLARRHVRRINLGWWGLYMVPLMTAVVLALSLTLLPLRKWELFSARTIGVSALLLVCFCALISYRRARQAFIDEAQALARLDAHCHLHNRLTAASQGVGAWPAPPVAAPPKPRWKPSRTLLPLFASLMTLLLATFLPLQASSPAAPPPLRELSSWTAVERAIERLHDQEVADEDALEHIREQLETLRAQPRENWYRPGSMEASDHLREQVGRSARDLQQALNAAAVALASAADTQLAEHEREAILEQLGQALDHLQQGALPLDAETLSKLSQLASSDALKGVALDPESLKKLLTQLRKQSESAGDCASLCRVEKTGQSACTNGQCMAQGAVCLSARACEDDGANATGGISRDKRGDTPLTFRPPQAPLQAGNREALSNRDWRQAAVGDTVGLSKGEHDVDRDTWSGMPADGGTAASEGQGGETVWRVPVMPQERALLKAYFD